MKRKSALSTSYFPEAIYSLFTENSIFPPSQGWAVPLNPKLLEYPVVRGLTILFNRENEMVLFVDLNLIGDMGKFVRIFDGGIDKLEKSYSVEVIGFWGDNIPPSKTEFLGTFTGIHPLLKCEFGVISLMGGDFKSERLKRAFETPLELETYSAILPDIAPIMPGNGTYGNLPLYSGIVGRIMAAVSENERVVRLMEFPDSRNPILNVIRKRDRKNILKIIKKTLYALSESADGERYFEIDSPEGADIRINIERLIANPALVEKFLQNVKNLFSRRDFGIQNQLVKP